MVNSIKKGKTYECEVANLLTERTGVKWHRVPMSGGFATVNKSDDPRFDGDVFTEDEQFNDLVIECKANKEVITLNALFSDKSLFWEWVTQAETESRDKRWLLFIKITRVGSYIVSENTEDLGRLGFPTTQYLTVIKNSVIGHRTLHLLKLK